MTRVTELCKAKDKPLKVEDLLKIKLERLEGTGAPAAKAKAAPKAEAAPPGDPPHTKTQPQRSSHLMG